jgi:hypothetical protein
MLFWDKTYRNNRNKKKHISYTFCFKNTEIYYKNIYFLKLFFILNSTSSTKYIIYLFYFKTKTKHNLKYHLREILVQCQVSFSTEKKPSYVTSS